MGNSSHYIWSWRVHEFKFSEQRIEFARILDVGASLMIVAAYNRWLASEGTVAFQPITACSEGANSGGVHVVAVQANRARIPNLIKSTLISTNTNAKY